MTIPKPTEEAYRRAITLQLVDYLGLEFKDCHVCEGTGDGHTWIPTCQTCYGIGRVMFQGDKQRIRNEAWAEYEKKRDNGWTEEQQKCFMAGMSVMWRLCKLEHSPLFTYGPDGKPKELDNG